MKSVNFFKQSCRPLNKAFSGLIHKSGFDCIRFYPTPPVDKYFLFFIEISTIMAVNSFFINRFIHSFVYDIFTTPHCPRKI